MPIDAEAMMAALRQKAAQSAQRSIYKARVLSKANDGTMILELEKLTDLPQEDEKPPIVRLASEFSPGSA